MTLDLEPITVYEACETAAQVLAAKRRDAARQVRPHNEITLVPYIQQVERAHAILVQMADAAFLQMGDEE